MVRQLPSPWRRPFIMGAGISRLFDEFFRDFEDIGFDFMPTYDRTDIYEMDGNLVFETELPGMKKEDIGIKVQEGRLVISGQCRRSEEVKEEHYFCIGRRYGKFQRAFPLPESIGDQSKIKARFLDGILKVIIPLKESIKEKGKPIEIRVE